MSSGLKAEDDLSRLLLSGALKPINNVVEGFEPKAVVGPTRTADQASCKSASWQKRDVAERSDKPWRGE